VQLGHLEFSGCDLAHFLRLSLKYESNDMCLIFYTFSSGLAGVVTFWAVLVVGVGLFVVSICTDPSELG
jgi:hypothetical protein